MIPKYIRRASSVAMVVLIFMISAAASFIVPADPVSSAPSSYELQIETYSDIEYAMISGSSEIKSEIQALHDWRERTGLNTEIFEVQEILSSDIGEDDAEKLFNFITQLYETSDGELNYVLLAGDSDLIPIRYLHAGASDYGLDDLYLSDVYYSSPGLDWDTNGNGIFGERSDIESIGAKNLSFPINVGRAPVSNRIEASRFVQRVIDYETSPEEGTWTKEGIISSSLMDTPNIIDDPLTPEDEGFNAYKDNGYKAILNYTLPNIPRSLDLIEAHDYTEYQGGRYSNENDTLDADTLPQMLSNGSAFFTFAGQSYYDVEYPVNPSLAYSLAQWIAPGDVNMEIGFDTALTHSDTWNLTNGGKLPVVYISSCDTANFSDPEGRDLSNLLYAPNGGAICLVGSTGISWRGEGVDYSLGNWYLMPRFWQKVVRDHMPGKALYDLKNDYLSTKWDEIATKEPLLVGLYAYNYLGDPALSSWLGSPKEMVVTQISDDIFAGKDSYEVSVTDSLGTPLLEATVSLSLNGAIFKGITGPDGKVTIRTEFNEGGSAHLTVTAKNYIPYLGDVFIDEEPPDVKAVPGSMVISPNRPSEETELNVSAEFQNSGDQELVDVEFAMFSRIIGSIDELGDIDPVTTRTMTIPGNSSITVSFTPTPLRSWDGITIFALPYGEELSLSDNFISRAVEINARPRFLPIPTVQLMEDSGSSELDLSDHVFEPDNDVLIYTIEPGAPTWVTMEGSILNISPPVNWSGLFSVDLAVSDGSTSDGTTVYVEISSVNDAPSLVKILPLYTAVVDDPFSLRLHTVDSEGDLVNITVSTDLKNLKMTGSTLRFVPHPRDVGSHIVNISVSDPLFAYNNYTITIEVIPSGTSLYFNEPSIHLPSATSGELYEHNISVGGDLADGAVFSDNTTLFDIDPGTGTISFTPSEEDEGDHWVKITVTSGNRTISRNFMFRIEGSTETPTFIYWLLGGGIVLLLVLIIALYIWSGRDMVQYGLEE